MKYVDLVNKYGFYAVKCKLRLTVRELNVLLAHELSIADGSDNLSEKMKARMQAADEMSLVVSRRTERGMYFTQAKWVLEQINSEWDCLQVVLQEVKNWADFESAKEICRHLADCIMRFECGIEV